MSYNGNPITLENLSNFVTIQEYYRKCQILLDYLVHNCGTDENTLEILSLYCSSLYRDRYEAMMNYGEGHTARQIAGLAYILLRLKDSGVDMRDSDKVQEFFDWVDNNYKK